MVAAPILQQTLETGAMNGGGGGATSNSSAFAHAAISWHARGDEGQREMRRCEQAHGCRPTRNSMCKRGARCGSGSRTLAFLDPLVWHASARSANALAGGATRDAAMRTCAQLSKQHVQARRALWSLFSDPRISRPLGVAWRKCTVGQRVGGRGDARCGDANRRTAVFRHGIASRNVNLRWEEGRRRRGRGHVWMLQFSRLVILLSPPGPKAHRSRI